MESRHHTRTVDLALIDDHPLLGAAIGELFPAESGVTFGGTVASVPAALELRPTPSLVILDLQLDDGSSPIANLRLLEAAGVATVVYTSGEDAFLVRSAARAGVSAIIRKSQPMHELAAAILAVASGATAESTDWAAAVDADPLMSSVRLSVQEERVLTLVASGHTMTSVAFQLGVGGRTVEDYLRRIRRKYASAGLPAATQIDLLKRAIDDGHVRRPMLKAAG